MDSIKIKVKLFTKSQDGFFSTPNIFNKNISFIGVRQEAVGNSKLRIKIIYGTGWFSKAGLFAKGKF